jgi:hypothetical protein
MTRVEHVDHARKSAQHCVKALLTAYTEPYACCYFYSSFYFVKGKNEKKKFNIRSSARTFIDFGIYMQPFATISLKLKVLCLTIKLDKYVIVFMFANDHFLFNFLEVIVE